MTIAANLKVFFFLILIGLVYPLSKNYVLSYQFGEILLEHIESVFTVNVNKLFSRQLDLHIF